MFAEMRRKDRMVTDEKQIEGIISRADVLHLGLLDRDFPYVVPLHYGYEYDSEKKTYIFYIHCASQGHKLDLIKANPNVCVEIDTDTEPVSGGADPCEYSAFFSSVIGRGKAFILTSPQEKKQGLNLLMKNQTGREFDFTEKMISGVTVIKIELSCFSAKAKQK